MNKNTISSMRYFSIILHFIIFQKKEILSLTVSSTNLIASGEYGNKPAIHIWDYNKLESVNIIKGIHDNGVMYMEFLYDNNFLATCSWRNNAQVIVYNIHDSSAVLSIAVKGLVWHSLSILADRKSVV